jgi:hypothetical protein
VCYASVERVKRAKIKKTSQLDDQKPKVAARPADECPWARPFPEGFDGCPVFAPQPFRPTDSRDRPLPQVLTCRSLVSRAFDQPKVGWYGACELGDAAARRTYLERKMVSVVKPGL